MKRIQWKPDQWLTVAKQSYSLLLDPTFMGTQIEAVRRAQQALAPEFHRGLNSMQEVKPKITDLWKALEDQGFKAEAPVIQATVNHAIEHEHRQIQSTMLLSDITTQDLMGEFMRRISDALDPATLRHLIRDEVNATLDRRMPGILPPDPDQEVPAVEELPDRPQRHRVLVLGLQGSQEEILKRKYKGVVEFHFMSGGEGGTRIKNTVGLMDFSVRSKWCKGHLGSTSGWPNFTATTGGIDSIQRLINQRFKIATQ